MRGDKLRLIGELEAGCGQELKWDTEDSVKKIYGQGLALAAGWR
jgi:hypothetical protein